MFEVKEYGEVMETYSILDERALVGQVDAKAEIGHLVLYGEGSVSGTGGGQVKEKKVT